MFHVSITKCFFTFFGYNSALKSKKECCRGFNFLPKWLGNFSQRQNYSPLKTRLKSPGLKEILCNFIDCSFLSFIPCSCFISAVFSIAIYFLLMQVPRALFSQGEKSNHHSSLAVSINLKTSNKLLTKRKQKYFFRAFSYFYEGIVLLLFSIKGGGMICCNFRSQVFSWNSNDHFWYYN